MNILSLHDYKARRLPPVAVLAGRGGVRHKHLADVLAMRRQRDGFALDPYVVREPGPGWLVRAARWLDDAGRYWLDDAPVWQRMAALFVFAVLIATLVL